MGIRQSINTPGHLSPRRQDQILDFAAIGLSSFYDHSPQESDAKLFVFQPRPDEYSTAKRTIRQLGNEAKPTRDQTLCLSSVSSKRHQEINDELTKTHQGLLIVYFTKSQSTTLMHLPAYQAFLLYRIIQIHSPILNACLTRS